MSVHISPCFEGKERLSNRPTGIDPLELGRERTLSILFVPVDSLRSADALVGFRAAALFPPKQPHALAQEADVAAVPVNDSCQAIY